MTTSEVVSRGRQKQRQARRSLAAVTCALVLVGGAGIVAMQRDGGDGESVISAPDAVEEGSQARLVFEDGTEVVVATTTAVIGSLSVELVEMPSASASRGEFALRLTNHGSDTMYINDTRSSIPLDDDGAVVLFDQHCGPEGICLDVWMGNQIHPGGALDLEMFVAILDPAAIQEDAIYRAVRPIETSASSFQPRPVPDDAVRVEVDLTIRVLPPQHEPEPQSDASPLTEGDLADGTYVVIAAERMVGGTWRQSWPTLTLGEDEHWLEFEPHIFFGGSDADEAAMADGVVDGPDQLPNNYYLRRLETGPLTLRVRTEVTPRVLVLDVTGSADATWEEMARVYDGAGGSDVDSVRWWPLEITVVDGEIVELHQMYLP
ncbi:MAG: hypothetical protein ACXIVQ_11090 [Acidimicrobiales bacterium]